MPNNHELLHGLEKQILPAYLIQCRWFGGKSQIIEQIKIEHITAFDCEAKLIYFLILNVSYQQGYEEQYNFPIACNTVEEFNQSNSENQQAIVCCSDCRPGNSWCLSQCTADCFASTQCQEAGKEAYARCRLKLFSCSSSGGFDLFLFSRLFHQM